MKILVCFKTVPEFEQVVDADWTHFNLDTDLRYVKRSFGCFDEIALESALRLKDELQTRGEQAECSAVTLGSLPPSLCKILFAAGFDHVQILDGSGGVKRPHEFQPRQTAAALKKYIAANQWDLILTGRQAGYADTGMIPLMLAEMLGFPLVTEAERLSPLNGKSLTIDRRSPNGRERIGIRLPAVVSMGNSPVSCLRAVTLIAQMQAANRSTETSAGYAVNTAANEAPKFIWERPKKECRFLPGGNAITQSIKDITDSLSEWGFL